MLDNKIKYILALFIILSLSMNAFSATNFTEDFSIAAPQSSSVDEVVGDDGAGDGAGDGTGDGTGDGAGDGTGDGAGDGAGDGTGDGTGDGNGSSDSDNKNTNNNKPGTSTFGNFSFGNSTGRGGNGSSFDIASLLDYFTKMMGGDNSTNATNTTNVANKTVNQVSDVPKVVTSTSYAPVSESPSVGVQSSHVVQRLRDNKTISEGNALTLDGLNKLYDSDFTNGHLIVYVDGKLVFNEITAGDLSTQIFQITDDYLGQHQITVEFTANGNSNTNKYTEDVLII